MYKQQGLSLVELMIAITLGLLLMVSMVQMFLGSKVTFTTQQGMSRVQETGRLAVEFIAQDIRMSGFTGFKSLKTSMENITGVPENILNKYGERISVVGAPTSEVASLENTDILAIRGALAGENVGLMNFLPTSKTITVPVIKKEVNGCKNGSERISGLCVDETLVIADYRKAFTFAPSSFADDGKVLTIKYNTIWGQEIDQIFTVGAMLSPSTNIIYFIKKNPSGNPSLYQRIDSAEAQELLEGVKDMSISFSRRLSPNNYELAAGKIDALWKDSVNPIVSLRIELLVMSIENNVIDQSQTYHFEGKDTKATDRRMYQVFTSTVALRNQLN